VTFEPGARTAWHTHPRGQTLIVTAGRGGATGRKRKSLLSLVTRAGGSPVSFEMLDSKMSTLSRADSLKTGFVEKLGALRIQADQTERFNNVR